MATFGESGPPSCLGRPGKNCGRNLSPSSASEPVWPEEAPDQNPKKIESLFQRTSYFSVAPKRSWISSRPAELGSLAAPFEEPLDRTAPTFACRENTSVVAGL